MSKYIKEHLMATVYHCNYPKSKELNKEIWGLFESQNQIWLSDVEEIANKLKLDDVGVVLRYIKLLAEGKTNPYAPSLLKQCCYQLSKIGDLVTSDLTTVELIGTLVNNHYSEDLFMQESFESLIQRVFPCWQPLDIAQEASFDSSFNKVSNSLAFLWLEWY